MMRILHPENRKRVDRFGSDWALYGCGIGAFYGLLLGFGTLYSSIVRSRDTNGTN